MRVCPGRRGRKEAEAGQEGGAAAEPPEGCEHGAVIAPHSGPHHAPRGLQQPRPQDTEGASLPQGADSLPRGDGPARREGQ